MTIKETLLTNVLDGLRGISKAAGYAIDLQTAELKNQLLRDLNVEDLPAVLVSVGTDDFDHETFAGGDGNTQYRMLDLLFYAMIIDEPDAVLPGAIVENAITKALLRLRAASGGLLPADIVIGAIDYSEFERMENGIGIMKIPVRLKYGYVLSDL